MDLESVWLGLLRDVAEESPSWVIYKNLDSALYGVGDVDAAASPAEWPRIQQVVSAYARRLDLGAVRACNHIPGGVNLIVVPSDAETVLEIGIKEYKAFRGSALFTWDVLQPFAVSDPRGFRLVRPGVEGFLKLLLNGMLRGGRPNWQGIRDKHVIEDLRKDPEGAAAAVMLVSRLSRPAARTLVSDAVSGRWNRLAAIAIESVAIGQAVIHPGTAVDRLSFRYGSSRDCPIVRVLLDGKRRIPNNRGLWLEEIDETHGEIT